DLADCTAEACLVQIAQLTKAVYVFHGRITSEYRQHQIVFKVFDAADGTEIANEAVDCSPSDVGCPVVAKNAYTGARLGGRKALQKIQSKARDRDSQAPTPQAAVPPTRTAQAGGGDPAPSAGPSGAGAPARPAVRTDQPWRRAAWIVAGVGGGVA